MSSRDYANSALVAFAALLLAVWLSSAGCFAPEYAGACPFSCAKKNRCPEGFSCVGGVKCCAKDPQHGLSEPVLWSDLRIAHDGAAGTDVGPPRGTLHRVWDTDEQWNQGTAAGTKVLEVGTPAYLTIVPKTGSATNGPGAVVEEGAGVIWEHWVSLTDHTRIHDPSFLINTSSYHEIFSDLSYNTTSKNLVAKSFKLALPANARINGVTVAITRFQSGDAPEIKDDNLQLVLGGAAIGANRGRTGDYWGERGRAGAAAFSYGGSSDLWGATLSAAQASDASFGITYRVKDYYNGDKATAWVQAVKMTINFTSLDDGEYRTEPVELPAGALGWDRVVANYQADAACGSEPVLLNILDDNGTKLIAQDARSSTLLLTDRKESPIRLWVQLRSASVDCKLKLEWLKLYAMLKDAL